MYSTLKAELGGLPMCIDAVFTWLNLEKDRQCELVNDEINKLKLRIRKRFSEAGFDNFRGLPDAAERKLSEKSYWTFDWDTGEKQLISGNKED